MKKVAVIGAGPAGMSAALAAAENGAEVTLYDHNEKIGKKLFITGKGRCNLTNAAPVEDFFDHIIRNKNFMYSSLYAFTNDMLMDQIESAGCPLKTERGGRVFPKSDKSSDVLKAFSKLLNKQKVNVVLNSHISSLIIKDGVCKGIVLKGEPVYYDAVILCSGGASYQSTGSDGSGYKIAREAGHTIKEIQPALVGLSTRERWPADISGLTLKNVGVKLLKDGKAIFSELGECLFTHSGLSGPVILSASSFINRPVKGYVIEIDLKPGLTQTQLDQRIQRDFKKYSNKQFRNSLSDLLPKGLIPIIIDQSGIDPEKKVNTVTKEERQKIVQLLKHLTLTVNGIGALKGAIVTRGGIEVKEINPQTLESKLIRNLYFAGEIIDVDALTGGFNIQIACSTGNLAGISAAQEE